ncbi:MAG: aldo/keto reductase [Kofleriaceae bacterium]
MVSRRAILQLAGLGLVGRRAFGDAPTMRTRAIPRTGELLPAIGLGTWQTFDVGRAKSERTPLAEVLTELLAAGGRVIDSSPMYGRAEEVTGDELAAIAAKQKPFLATKVWTSGKREGQAQIARSMQRMRTKVLDLLQVHNLVDVHTHLPVLRDLKAAGTIRYLGVTHYQHGAFDQIEKLMKTEQLDFIQIPYSIVDRAVEKRILPTAQDTGTAVLVMTPFESGDLFRQVKGKALPAWASELDCASWAQFFLKFLLGHPAVNCPIPATSKPAHVADNVLAGVGRLPDAKQREKMAALLG